MSKRNFLLYFLLFLGLNPLFANNCITKLKSDSLNTLNDFENQVFIGLNDENIESGFIHFYKAIRLLDTETKPYKGILYVYAANRLKDIGRFEESLFYLDTALVFAKSSCPKLLKHCYSSMSQIHWINENYEQAIAYRLKHKEFADNYLDSLISDYNLISIYHDLKDTSFVELYLEEFNKKLNTEPQKIHPITEIMFKMMETKYRTSFQDIDSYYQNLYELAYDFNPKFKIQIQINEAEYHKKRNPKRAKQLYSKMLPHIESLGYRSYKNIILLSLSELLVKERAFQEAETLLTRLNSNAIEGWLLDDYYSLNFEVYKEIEVEKSTYFAEQLIAYRDSLNKVNEKKSYAKWSKKYQTESKEKEILIANYTLLKQNDEIKNNRILIYGLILVIAIVLLGIFLIKRELNLKKAYSQAIHQKNKEINIRNSELEKAIETKQKLFAIISHDMITPYNALLYQIKQLTGIVEQDDNYAYIKMLLNKIETGINSNFKLANELLIWAKANNEQIVADPETIQLTDLVNSILEPYSLILDHKKINLILEDNIDLKLYSDTNLLSIVLSNFLNNAIKYTEKDGQIKLSAKSHQNHCTIEIQDTGAGLSPEEIELINNRVKTKPEQNSGIGLTICEDILEILDGSFELKSTFGEGTKVVVTLNQ